MIPPQIALFEISIIFEQEKTTKLVSYIVTVLIQLVEPVKLSSNVLGTNSVPKT